MLSVSRRFLHVLSPSLTVLAFFLSIPPYPSLLRVFVLSLWRCVCVCGVRAVPCSGVLCCVLVCSLCLPLPDWCCAVPCRAGAACGQWCVCGNWVHWNFLIFWCLVFLDLLVFFLIKKSLHCLNCFHVILSCLDSFDISMFFLHLFSPHFWDLWKSFSSA